MENKKCLKPPSSIYIYTRTLLASRIPFKKIKKKNNAFNAAATDCPCVPPWGIYIYIYYHLILIVIFILYIYIMNIQISFFYVIVMCSSLNLHWLINLRTSAQAFALQVPASWGFWAHFTGTVNRKNQEPKSPKTSWIRARTCLNWC